MQVRYDRLQILKEIKKMAKYGYIRVSTKEQNIERQVEAMLEYGLTERDLFIDKTSGKNFDRPEYQLLKGRVLREGDVLVIKELDRLGRDMDSIKNEWRDLEEMGVSIEVIDMPMVNTTGKSDLERKLISNIVFELLCYVAQKEREKILQRSKEGMEAMVIDEATGKKKSVKTGRVTGRPVAEMPSNFEEIYDKVFINKEMTALKGMEALGLKKSTFYKFKKEIDIKRGLI